MRYYGPLAAAFVLVTTCGVVHGLITDRWGMPSDVAAAAKKLQNVPPVLGDWESVEIPMSSRELEIAEAVGHLSRRYTNRADGRVIDVLIVCGRPGPISVHPPTVCFAGAGFALQSFEKDVAVKVRDSGSQERFCVGDFAKQSSGTAVRMRTFWTWSSTGQWQVPSNPRITFAREPHLYKMYLTRPLSEIADTEAIKDDPIVEFMQTFVPALDRALFETKPAQG